MPLSLLCVPFHGGCHSSAQIAVHEENDPAVLGVMEAKAAKAKESADRWTGGFVLMLGHHFWLNTWFSGTNACTTLCHLFADNIYALRKYLVEKGVEPGQADSMVRACAC
jgi:hypothetical protein